MEKIPKGDNPNDFSISPMSGKDQPELQRGEFESGYSLPPELKADIDKAIAEGKNPNELLNAMIAYFKSRAEQGGQIE